MKNKIAQMYSAIQTGYNQGMQTLDQHLQELRKSNVITNNTALEVATNRDLFL